MFGRIFKRKAYQKMLNWKAESNGKSALHQGTSFPVGKVDMLKIHPLDFEEFLWATGNKNLAKSFG